MYPTGMRGTTWYAVGGALEELKLSDIQGASGDSCAGEPPDMRGSVVGS